MNRPLDRCSEDIFTTACVIENDLKQFKQDYPNIRKIHCRSDNASCYAGASSVMVKREIAEKLDLDITAIDFSDAQKGKDQCDRYGAVAKRAIKSYVNEGHNDLNAIQIKEALDNSSGSLRNSKASVISVDASESNLEKAKIPNIGRYHYFKPESTGLRAWEFQGIGTGKHIPYQPLNFHPSYDVLVPFQDAESSKKSDTLMKTKSRKSTAKLFYHDRERVEVFTTEKELDAHLNIGKHSYFMQVDKQMHY